MIRRLLLLCALVALVSENAYGLGLGKLELQSALNQEFRAEIELTNVRGLEVEEILPSLATPADFQRAGIERSYQLTDLRFKVVRGADGKLVVQLTSTRPVVEPFLNFIVEVLWPNGRILREYTVLLDPPVFGGKGIQPLQEAETQTRPESPRQSAVTPSQKTTTTQPRQSLRSRLEEGSVAGDEYGMTGPGDTLWAIAAKVRPTDAVSVQQTMLAIQRANPEAFINNNINLLKAGHVLRIPNIDEIRQETFASAVKEVRTQNEEFKVYRSGTQVAQLDASGRQRSTSGASSGRRDDGELRLLASDSRSGERAGSGSSADTQALEGDLAVAREDLDRARRANAEMNVRLDDLQGQVETLNSLVTAKDDQLAALRAQVQKMQAASEAAPVAQVTTQPQQDGSLLTNPYVLIGLGLIVVGAAAGGLVVMRRRKQAAGFEEETFEAFAAEDDDDDDTTSLVAETVELEEEEEELSPQTSDVISEVEIYIAYGRFPQAITFLQNAIESEPSRADIQLKLLEVYVQTEDATAFNLQLEQLRSLGDDGAIKQALALQKKIPGAAEAEEVSMGATIVSSEPIAAISDTSDDDDDMSFDLDDLDAETEDDSLGEELDLDINLDDDGEKDAELSLDDAALDLDLAADSSDDEVELDLDLDDDDAGEELAFDDDGVISLDEEDLEGEDIDLGLEEAAAETGDVDLGLDDDAIELDLDDDDGEIELDLGGADDAIELDLDGDDDAIELNLDDDDDGIDLNLDDDDGIELNLDDDDDGIELNLDEDASTKLDLARAYIDMGDSDGARNVLEEVIKEGSDSEIQEANELLAKID